MSKNFKLLLTGLLSVGMITSVACTPAEEEHVHKLNKTEATAPTCTGGGNTEYYYCSGCEKYFSDSAAATEISLSDTKLAALGHSLTKTDEKAASCTENGNIAYWTCGSCDKLFSDAEGKTVITREDTVTVSEVHGTLTKTEANEATCLVNGNIAYWTCGDCGKLYSDEECKTQVTLEQTVTTGVHALVKTNAKAETCTEGGNHAYWTCSVCDKVYSDENGENQTTVAKMQVAAHHTPVYRPTSLPTWAQDGNIEHWQCSACDAYFGDEACTEALTAGDIAIARRVMPVGGEAQDAEA